jgi:transcriptional regulator with XRE-family HTH domain
MASSLGRFIRKRRLELGLSQEQLAERIGDTMRQAGVSRLEGDRVVQPRRARLIAIAAALEVSLGELFVRTGWIEDGVPLETITRLVAGPDGPTADTLDGIPPHTLAAMLERAGAVQASLDHALRLLEQAETSMADLQRMLAAAACPRGEIHPRMGIIADWESGAMFYA